MEILFQIFFGRGKKLSTQVRHFHAKEARAFPKTILLECQKARDESSYR